MSKQLIYALKDGVITSVLDVKSGKDCGCTCPACGAPLVAKHPRASSKRPRMDHFAHADGYNCEFGYQYSLHLAAQDILSKAKKMVIPQVAIETRKGVEIIAKKQEITIDRVELEKHYDGFIPDVVVYSGNKVLFIEIYVTHRVDEAKLRKLKDANISTIEIGIGESAISIEKLSHGLLNHGWGKWIHNKYAEEMKKSFYASMDQKRYFMNKYHHPIAYDCPLSKGERSFPMRIPDTYQTIYVQTCYMCPYYWGLEDGGIVKCGGRDRIVHFEDFLKRHKKQTQKG